MFDEHGDAVWQQPKTEGPRLCGVLEFPFYAKCTDKLVENFKQGVT